MEDTEGWWHPQATAVGREGTLELVARGTAALTYRELCVPDDLEHRGVTDIPNYHYRDDALEIWGAIERWGGDMGMGTTGMGPWEMGPWRWGHGDGNDEDGDNRDETAGLGHGDGDMGIRPRGLYAGDGDMGMETTGMGTWG